MKSSLVGDKRFAYVDLDPVHFEAGTSPADSQHRHVDGSIVARPGRSRRSGHNLHDMKARFRERRHAARYLAYQSSEHCASSFVTSPVTMTMPELIPNSTASTRVSASSRRRSWRSRRLDRAHRWPLAAPRAGRLWRRLAALGPLRRDGPRGRARSSIIGCYGTVFRPPATLSLSASNAPLFL